MPPSTGYGSLYSRDEDYARTEQRLNGDINAYLSTPDSKRFFIDLINRDNPPYGEEPVPPSDDDFLSLVVPCRRSEPNIIAQLRALSDSVLYFRFNVGRYPSALENFGE